MNTIPAGRNLQARLSLTVHAKVTLRKAIRKAIKKELSRKALRGEA